MFLWRNKKNISTFQLEKEPNLELITLEFYKKGVYFNLNIWKTPLTPKGLIKIDP